MHRVVRHAAVDVVLDRAGPLRSICKVTPDFDLVSCLRRGVDERQASPPEEVVHKLGIVEQRTLDQSYIGEALELLRDDPLERVYLSAHGKPNGRGDAYERRCLPAGGVDDGDDLARLLCHSECGFSSEAVRQNDEGPTRGRGMQSVILLPWTLDREEDDKRYRPGGLRSTISAVQEVRGPDGQFQNAGGVLGGRVKYDCNG